MKTTNKTYGVRSDLHARMDLAKKQFVQVRERNYAGLFDLGDVECTHIGGNHCLRGGQKQNELTSEAIARNSLDLNGQLTEDGKKVVEETLLSAKEVRKLIERYAFVYQGIAGNAVESWTHIFSLIANSEQQERLKNIFSGFSYLREAKGEIFVAGKRYSVEEARELGSKPTSGVLYLPWKAPMSSVQQALTDLETFDLQKIVVMSHDYLTRGSLDPVHAAKIKPMQNEEQVVTVLDQLAERDCEIAGYYGHIGLQYGPSDIAFQHKGRTIRAFHTDEKEGKLLEVKL